MFVFHGYIDGQIELTKDCVHRTSAMNQDRQIAIFFSPIGEVPGLANQ